MGAQTFIEWRWAQVGNVLGQQGSYWLENETMLELPCLNTGVHNGGVICSSSSTFNTLTIYRLSQYNLGAQDLACNSSKIRDRMGYWVSNTVLCRLEEWQDR